MVLDGLGKGHRALSVVGTALLPPAQDRSHQGTVPLWKRVLRPQGRGALTCLESSRPCLYCTVPFSANT